MKSPGTRSTEAGNSCQGIAKINLLVSPYGDGCPPPLSFGMQRIGSANCLNSLYAAGAVGPVASPTGHHYLINISGDLMNPKIIEDLQLETDANIATRDSLTKLHQRSVFDFFLDRMVQEHRRHNRALSFLLLDIDDFKIVNDQYGQPGGG